MLVSCSRDRSGKLYRLIYAEPHTSCSHVRPSRACAGFPVARPAPATQIRRKIVRDVLATDRWTGERTRRGTIGPQGRGGGALWSLPLWAHTCDRCASPSGPAANGGVGPARGRRAGRTRDAASNIKKKIHTCRGAASGLSRPACAPGPCRARTVRRRVGCQRDSRAVATRRLEMTRSVGLKGSSNGL